MGSEMCIRDRFLVEHEWAQTADDILQRRTKYGLHLSPSEVVAFTDWFDVEFRENYADTPNTGTPITSSSNSKLQNMKSRTQKPKYEDTIE